MRRILGVLSLALVLSPTLGAADAPTPADRAALVEGDTKFAMELYHQLRCEKATCSSRRTASPTALAMTYAGARGETADEMAKTLHFALAQDKLHPAFARPDQGNQRRRQDQNAATSCSTANALWGQKGYPLPGRLPQAHQGRLRRRPARGGLLGATEAARKTINAWVEKQTHDKIKDLLKPGVLDADTRLVLTNAIYFKGDWASQFKKDATKRTSRSHSAAARRSRRR